MRQVACATGQGGQTGAEGSVQAFNEGSIDPAQFALAKGNQLINAPLPWTMRRLMPHTCLDYRYRRVARAYIITDAMILTCEKASLTWHNCG